MRGLLEPVGGGQQAGQREGQRQGRRRRLGGQAPVQSHLYHATQTGPNIRCLLIPDSLAESSSTCPVRSDHVRNHQPSKPAQSSHRPCRSVAFADRSLFQPRAPEGWATGSQGLQVQIQTALVRARWCTESSEGLNGFEYVQPRTQPLRPRTGGCSRCPDDERSQSSALCHFG